MEEERGRWGKKKSVVVVRCKPGTEKINKTRIRARFPMETHKTVSAAKGSLTVGG